METLNLIINNLTLFPTNIMTAVFAVLFCLLLVSFLAGLDQDLGIDFDLDGETDMGIISKIFISSGISKVPLVIGLAITSFIGLSISYVLQFKIVPFLFPTEGILKYAIGIPVFLVVLFVSLYIAGVICKPLEGLFDNEKTRATFDYIGKKGKVITLEVNDTYGEILIETDVHNYHVDVYCNENLKKDDEVVVVSLNKETNKYLIEKV